MHNLLVDKEILCTAEKNLPFKPHRTAYRSLAKQNCRSLAGQNCRSLAEQSCRSLVGHYKVLFTDCCRWQNFCSSHLCLVDRLYTVIHKRQTTRTKALPSAMVGE